MEIASWPFLDQYSSRPNQQFFQYLTHPKEVFLMLWGSYKSLLIITAIFLLFFVKLSWKGINLLLINSHQWPYSKQIIVLPFCVILLTLGARSGIGQANANPGLAAFSNNHLLNQLSLNASYSLSYAAYLSRRSTLNSKELFGDMPEQEVISRIKKYMDAAEEDFISDEIPTLHIQRPTITRGKPLNFVIILMEGFGSDHIGILTNTDSSKLNKDSLTPNFDQLSKEGVLLSNIHSIGTRTSRGITYQHQNPVAL